MKITTFNRRKFLQSSSASIAAGAVLSTLPQAVHAARFIGLDQSSAARDLFPHPQILRYDGQCFTIHGQDTFIYSGSFHYFRCPKELWPQRFEKIKAAGLNCVESYVPWNVHEPDEPSSLDDFSKVNLRDYEDFLNMAAEHKLYVISRVGPFICAEWNRGAFPGWLVTKRPASYNNPTWFRSNEPLFQAWSRHWLNAVLPIVARHQITRGASPDSGVILLFLENEFGHTAFPLSERTAVMRALGAEALAHGIDVPLAACEDESVIGSQDPVFRHYLVTTNSYPDWDITSMAAPLTSTRRRQPNGPSMISEGEAGAFDFAWDKPQLRPDADTYRVGLSPDPIDTTLVGAEIENFALFALQSGVTALNLYMLVGGTNLGDTGGKDIATTYDCAAPIRECGGVGEKYRRVAAIGQMLAEHGVALARSKAVDCAVTTGQNDVTVAMRADAAGNRYLFVRTSQHQEARRGTAKVQELAGGKSLSFDYDLELGGARILFVSAGEADARKGEWLPKRIPPTAPLADLPGPVTIAEVSSRTDAGPVAWKALAPGASLNEVGIYDRRNVYYRAYFTLDANALTSAGKLRLRIAYPTLSVGSWHAGDNGTRDHVPVTVNGQYRGEADAINGDLVLPASAFHAGKNEIVMLYQNSGYMKEDAWMEKLAGIRGVRLLPALTADRPLPDWKMHLLPNADNLDARPEVAAAFDDRDWQAVNIEKEMGDQLENGQTAVFRTSFEITAEEIASGKTALFLRQLSDYGRVYCNGKKVGQTNTRITSHTLDLSGALHPGRNELAIFALAQNNIANSGLGLPWLTWPLTAGIQPDRPLEYSGEPAGISEKWYQVTLGQAEWTTKALPEPPSTAESLLAWRRLHFQLPAVRASLRVPWLVRLFARGEGNIYINGIHLGHYSEIGAQRDFYLPECWLKFGSNEQNVIALCLRPGAHGTGVQSAEIIPYTVYAEELNRKRNG